MYTIFPSTVQMTVEKNTPPLLSLRSIPPSHLLTIHDCLLSCLQGNNVQLLKWWSQYLESRGEFEKARKTCTRAQDYLSLVRLACQGGQVERVRRNTFYLVVSHLNASSMARIFVETVPCTTGG